MVDKTPAVHCAHDEIKPLDEFKPNPRNPNKHPDGQIQLLAKIIEAQGWRAPITVSRRSGFITRGHARLQAAKLAKFKTAPVDYQDYDSNESEIADMIADNRLAELADADMQEVKALIDELEKAGTDLDLTGYDDESIKALEFLIKEDMPDMGDVDHQIPETKKSSTTKIGDLFKLGNHFLLCGDATNADHYTALLKGVRPDIVFTDPPYGVGFEYNLYDDKKTKEQHKEFCDKWFSILRNQSDFIIITVGFGNEHIFYELEKSFHHLVWHKKFSISASPISFARVTEPIFVLGKPPIKRYDTDYFEIGTDREKDLHEKHPCPKPVELMAKLIMPQTRQGGTVLDVFGGSGSTMIACEKIGRSCYTMEFDPCYVDIIIERWEKLSGKKAEKLN